MPSLAHVVCLFASVVASNVAFGQSADSCRCVHPSANGVEWSNGLQPGPSAPDARYQSEAAAYGAIGREDAQVHVQVGFRVVSFSPWCSFAGPKVRRFEDARQRWLKDHGYVGGVRTFRRDTQAAESTSPPKAEIEPRAVIEIAPDVPRLRSRPQVRVVPQEQSMRRSASVGVKVATPVVQISAK